MRFKTTMIKIDFWLCLLALAYWNTATCKCTSSLGKEEKIKEFGFMRKTSLVSLLPCTSSPPLFLTLKFFRHNRAIFLMCLSCEGFMQAACVFTLENTTLFIRCNTDIAVKYCHFVIWLRASAVWFCSCNCWYIISLEMAWRSSPSEM